MKAVEEEYDANINAILRLIQKDGALGVVWSESDVRIAVEAATETMVDLEQECKEKYGR